MLKYIKNKDYAYNISIYQENIKIDALEILSKIIDLKPLVLEPLMLLQFNRSYLVQDQPQLK